MTKQEIFDRVVNHLLTQNKRAVDYTLGYPKCMYRTNEGLKCAVGCLIPDDAYDPRMEGYGIRQLYTFGAFLIIQGFADHILFLEELQSVHDGYPPTEWKDLLEEVAKRYGLEWNYAGV